MAKGADQMNVYVCTVPIISFDTVNFAILGSDSFHLVAHRILNFAEVPCNAAEKLLIYVISNFLQMKDKHGKNCQPLSLIRKHLRRHCHYEWQFFCTKIDSL